MLIEKIAENRVFNDNKERSIQLSSFYMKKFMEELNKQMETGKKFTFEDNQMSIWYNTIMGIFEVHHRAYRDDSTETEVEEAIYNSIFLV